MDEPQYLGQPCSFVVGKGLLCEVPDIEQPKKEDTGPGPSKLPKMKPLKPSKTSNIKNPKEPKPPKENKQVQIISQQQTLTDPKQSNLNDRINNTGTEKPHGKTMPPGPPEYQRRHRRTGSRTGTGTVTATVEQKTRNDVDNKDLQRQQEKQIDYVFLGLGICALALFFYIRGKA